MATEFVLCVRVSVCTEPVNLRTPPEALSGVLLARWITVALSVTLLTHKDATTHINTDTYGCTHKHMHFQAEYTVRWAIRRHRPVFENFFSSIARSISDKLCLNMVRFFYLHLIFVAFTVVVQLLV